VNRPGSPEPPLPESDDYLTQDANRCGFHLNRPEFESCPVGRIEEPSEGPLLARPDRNGHRVQGHAERNTWQPSSRPADPATRTSLSPRTSSLAPSTRIGAAFEGRSGEVTSCCPRRRKRVGAISIGSALPSLQEKDKHEIHVVDRCEQQPVVCSRSTEIVKTFHDLEGRQDIPHQ